MISSQKIRNIAALSLLLTLLPFQGTGAQPDIDDEHKAKNLSVLNYVTGWSLDAAGYHPAVYMLLENISGRDLSGVTIKMQGKFTDVHTLEPSTAKLEVRRSLKPHQQFPVALVAPKEFELPRDTQFWPVMECKAMMRVGDVSDEGTEYLIVTKIDSNTATQDEAFQKLNELTSYNRSNQTAASGHRDPRAIAMNNAQAASRTQPLIAKADRIKPLTATPKALSTTAPKASNEHKHLPSLGEDFYNFEKEYGLPVATDAKRKDFTWAKYRQAGAEIIVASKERSGKADLIAFVLPGKSAKSDQTLFEELNTRNGLGRTEKLSPVTKSVRYLPSGRLEISTSKAGSLKFVSIPMAETPEHSAAQMVVISRLPQEPEDFLRSHQPDNDVLKGLSLGNAPG